MTVEDFLNTIHGEEILLIDKPRGLVSFDIVRRLRKLLGVRKIGFAGTLDPRASGLMVVGVGEGTKKLHEYTKLSKVYEAEILIGESRTTGDLDGEIVASVPVGDLSRERVEEALAKLQGSLFLPVPRYSAIKQGGTALYAKARRGEDFEVPIKPMEVRAVSLKSIRKEGDRVRICATFDVGSGTYIRSLAEKLGEELGYPATLAELRRVSVGDFLLKDALPLP